MTFFSYLESAYVKANLEVQKEFSIAKQAEANAAQKLIGYQRTFYTYVGYLAHIVGYLLTRVGARKALPSPVEQQAAYVASLAPASPPPVAAGDMANEVN